MQDEWQSVDDSVNSDLVPEAQHVGRIWRYYVPNFKKQYALYR